MSPLRVIVVDDNPTLLRSVVRLLVAMPDVEVIGQATSGLGALELAAQLRPDLLLIDVAMPTMDGLEATRRLSIQPGAPTILLMSVHDLVEYRDAARAAGAHDFLTKSRIAEDLAPMIQSLLLKRSGDESGPA